jgi:hypothetical protein
VFQVSVATTAISSMLDPVRRLEIGPAAKLLVLLAFAGLSTAWMVLLQWKGAPNNYFVRNQLAHNRFVQASALALLFVLALAACGGGGGNSGGGSGTGTPAGTYSLTATGTVAGASQTIQLTLIVQ